jgi:hypothetical protein
MMTCSYFRPAGVRARVSTLLRSSASVRSINSRRTLDSDSVWRTDMGLKCRSYYFSISRRTIVLCSIRPTNLSRESRQ